MVILYCLRSTVYQAVLLFERAYSQLFRQRWTFIIFIFKLYPRFSSTTRCFCIIFIFIGCDNDLLLDTHKVHEYFVILPEVFLMSCCCWVFCLREKFSKFVHLNLMNFSYLISKIFKNRNDENFIYSAWLPNFINY